MTALQYAGQYTDAESGLQYERARYYDPTTGQFLSRDPMGAITRESYGYVHGNPLNLVDPTGLYDYQYDFWLGSIKELGGEYTAMWYLQRHFGSLFPFDTGGCASVVLNEECDLHPVPAQPFYPGHDSWIRIIDVQPLSFTFCSEPGHVAGPNGTITFSTYRKNGDVWLRIVAHAPDANGAQNFIDPKGAWWNWMWLAVNLRQALLDPSRWP
jgi:RHS repeat-associated protein